MSDQTENQYEPGFCDLCEEEKPVRKLTDQVSTCRECLIEQTGHDTEEAIEYLRNKVYEVDGDPPPKRLAMYHDVDSDPDFYDRR